MSNTTKIIIGIIAVLLIGVGIYYFTHRSQPQLVGAIVNQGMLAENYDPYLKVNQGYYSNLPITTNAAITANQLQVGSTTGTVINNIVEGSCVLMQYANTITSSSTYTTDCQAATTSTTTPTAINGIKPGDHVVVTLASTTGAYAVGQGLDSIAATASSSAGFISVTLENSTGGTFTWPVSASTSVNYIDFR